MLRLLLPFLLALALVTPAATETLTGRVVGVSDGDTLTVLVGRTQHKIRLHAIDTRILFPVDINPSRGDASGAG